MDAHAGRPGRWTPRTIEEGLRADLAETRAKLRHCELTLRQHEIDRADPGADALGLVHVGGGRADVQSQLSDAIKAKAGLADMLSEKKAAYDEIEAKYRAVRRVHREQLESNALLTRQLKLALEVAAGTERMRAQVADAEQRLEAAVSDADVAQLVDECQRMVAAAGAGATRLADHQAEQIAGLQAEVRRLREAATPLRVAASPWVDEAVPPRPAAIPAPGPRPRTEPMPAASPAAKDVVQDMVMSRYDDPQEAHGHFWPRSARRAVVEEAQHPAISSSLATRLSPLDPALELLWQNTLSSSGADELEPATYMYAGNFDLKLTERSYADGAKATARQTGAGAPNRALSREAVPRLMRSADDPLVLRGVVGVGNVASAGESSLRGSAAVLPAAPMAVDGPVSEAAWSDSMGYD